MTDRNLADFLKRIIFGLATANFFAVIQLVNAPQFQTAWEAVSRPVRMGKIGMMLMIANVPLSFAWILCHDLKAFDRKKGTSFTVAACSAFLAGLGLTGLALTLRAFNPVLGETAFFAIYGAATLVIIAISMKRKND